MHMEELIPISHYQSSSTLETLEVSAMRCSSDAPSSEISSSNDVIKLDNRLPTTIKVTTLASRTYKLAISGLNGLFVIFDFDHEW